MATSDSDIHAATVLAGPSAALLTLPPVANIVMTDDSKSRLCESDGRSIRSLWRFGCGYILLLLLPPIGFLIGCVVGLVRGGGGDFVEVTMVGYGIVGAFTGLAVAISLFLLVTVILYVKDG